MYILNRDTFLISTQINPNGLKTATDDILLIGMQQEGDAAHQEIEHSIDNLVVDSTFLPASSHLLDAGCTGPSHTDTQPAAQPAAQQRPSAAQPPDGTRPDNDSIGNTAAPDVKKTSSYPSHYFPSTERRSCRIRPSSSLSFPGIRQSSR